MPRKKSLLSRVPKSARDEIKWLMQERDGELPLHEFLAKRWEYSQPNFLWHFPNDDHARRMEENRSHLAERFSERSEREIGLMIAFQCVRYDLFDTGVARRFVLEDPEELAVRLALDLKLDLLAVDGRQTASTSREGLLMHCAVRDVVGARQRSDGKRPGLRAFPDRDDAVDIAVTAMVREDWAALKAATSVLSELSLPKWMEGLAECLTAASDRNPTQVVAGLNRYLRDFRQLQMKSELEAAINLSAQGLYRLFEWMSPEFVAEFDVAQDFPWDAGFHQWLEEHPEPLAGLDLSSVSPILHDAVVNDIPPFLVERVPEDNFEVVLVDIPSKPSTELCSDIGRYAGIRGTKREIAALLDYAPVTLFWGLTKDFAHAVLNRIQSFGGTAEVREMDSQIPRLFTSKRGTVNAC